MYASIKKQEKPNCVCLKVKLQILFYDLHQQSIFFRWYQKGIEICDWGVGNYWSMTTRPTHCIHPCIAQLFQEVQMFMKKFCKCKRYGSYWGWLLFCSPGLAWPFCIYWKNILPYAYTICIYKMTFFSSIE